MGEAIGIAMSLSRPEGNLIAKIYLPRKLILIMCISYYTDSLRWHKMETYERACCLGGYHILKDAWTSLSVELAATALDVTNNF